MVLWKNLTKLKIYCYNPQKSAENGPIEGLIKFLPKFDALRLKNFSLRGIINKKGRSNYEFPVCIQI